MVPHQFAFSSTHSPASPIRRLRYSLLLAPIRLYRDSTYSPASFAPARVVAQSLKLVIFHFFLCARCIGPAPLSPASSSTSSAPIRIHSAAPRALARIHSAAARTLACAHSATAHTLACAHPPAAAIGELCRLCGFAFDSL